MTPRDPDARVQWLAAIIASSGDAIISKTLDGTVTSWNPAAERIFGYPAADMIGQPMLRLFPEHLLDEERVILERVRRGEHIDNVESVRRHADGHLIDVAISVSPVRAGDGTVIGVSTIARDITEHKARARDLARMTRLYAALSQVNQAIVWAESRADLLQRICRVMVNDGGFRLAWIGWNNPETHTLEVAASHGDTTGLLQRILIRSDDTPQGRGPSGTAFREARAYICNDITVDPGTLPWRETVLAEGIRAVASLPIRFGGRIVGILSVCAAEAGVFQAPEIALLTEAAMDVSYGLDQLHSMETLRESEQRFRQLAETIYEVLWITDPAKQEILYISPAYASIWGRPTAELYANPLSWGEAIHPDDRDRVLHAAQTQQTSGEYDETYRIVRPDGEERWIRDRAFPVRDASGTPFRVVGVAQDITDQRRLEQQFLRAQRMESVGTLASGIAHDLNNVFAPILMGLSLLEARLPDDDARSLLQTLQTSAERGANLVRQVLTFARGTSGERVPVPIGPLLEELRRVTQDTFPRSIAIRLDAGSADWTVTGDPTQLHQVFMNLLVNARDAMPQGGTLTMTIEPVRIDETYAAMNPDARPGAYYRVTVADTGVGIPADHLAKIFEPFFTTKGIAEGTGLGLSTSQSIVRSHGGFINVYSEPGLGTRFSVYLPALGDRAATPDVVRAGARPRGHGELILVVDDEAGVRDVARVTLEAFGYRTLLATNGAEGVSLYARHRREIAVVLTDMAMPIMDGAALIAALRSMNPDVRIIASSGLATNASVVSTGDTRNLFLAKPYSADALLTAIDALIRSDPR